MNPVAFPALGFVVAMAQSAPVPQIGQHWHVRTEPVTVEAVLLEGCEANAEQMADYSFDIIVNKGSGEFHIETMIIAVQDLPEAIQVLKETTAWIPPYLFVRSECGGGNAWACEREVVFKLVNGRIIRFGEFAVGDDRSPARSFKGGAFFDLYDKLEGAPPCHAQAPSFRLVIRDEKGLATADLSRTWAENAPAYAEKFQFIRSCSTECDAGDVFSAVANCAALAKYCSRKTELRQVLRLSTKVLSKERQEDLEEVLALVVPLELPARWREPR